MQVWYRNGVLQAGEVCSCWVPLQKSSDNQSLQLITSLYQCSGLYTLLMLLICSLLNWTQMTTSNCYCCIIPGQFVVLRRLTLLGYIVRMDDNADAKRILLVPPPADWRRQPGRPHITWLSTVQQDLRHHHLTLPEAADLAQNRRLLTYGTRILELHARNDDWPVCSWEHRVTNRIHSRL